MKNTEPKSFTKGESLTWTRCTGDYRIADGWTLTYYFRGVGTGFDAILNSENVAAVGAATTIAMQPGDYVWQLFAARLDENILLDSGVVKVLPGLSAIGATTAFDGRTESKKILDAIRAMIGKKATLDQQEYAIGNRQLKRIPLTELIALESKYAVKVAREAQAERLKKGGKFFKQVLVRLK